MCLLYHAGDPFEQPGSTSTAIGQHDFNSSDEVDQRVFIYLQILKYFDFFFTAIFTIEITIKVRIKSHKLLKC